MDFVTKFLKIHKSRADQIVWVWRMRSLSTGTVEFSKNNHAIMFNQTVVMLVRSVHPCLKVLPVVFIIQTRPIYKQSLPILTPEYLVATKSLRGTRLMFVHTDRSLHGCNAMVITKRWYHY